MQINHGKILLINFALISLFATFKKNTRMVSVIAVSVVLVLIGVGLLSIRLLLIKGGDFKGTCAGNSAFLQKEGAVCGVCGRRPGEACANETQPV